METARIPADDTGKWLLMADFRDHAEPLDTQGLFF